MMPLDSWIDEEALAMMRALAPKTSAATAPPAPQATDLPEQESALFSSQTDERETVPNSPSPPRIARADEAAPEAVERMRQRLAEIRRRAERGGIVRSNPVPVPPSLPSSAPVEESPPSSGGLSANVTPTETPESAPCPESKPAEETAPIPPPPPVAATPVSAPSFPAPAPIPAPAAAVPETSWIEPPHEPVATSPGPVDSPPAEPESPAPDKSDPPAPSAFPKPLLPPLEIEETWESESLPPLEPLAEPNQPEASPAAAATPISSTSNPAPPPTPMPATDGPLSVRIAALRRWLEADCGFTAPLVIDQRGNALHPADGLEPMIAAAASLGSAWAEACSAASPGTQPQAAHSAWGGQTLAVVPVPTRLGELHVAGIVKSAVSPESATLIAHALRRAAGV